MEDFALGGSKTEESCSGVLSHRVPWGVVLGVLPRHAGTAVKNNSLHHVDSRGLGRCCEWRENPISVSMGCVRVGFALTQMLQDSPGPSVGGGWG